MSIVQTIIDLLRVPAGVGTLTPAHTSVPATPETKKQREARLAALTPEQRAQRLASLRADADRAERWPGEIARASAEFEKVADRVRQIIDARSADVERLRAYVAEHKEELAALEALKENAEAKRKT
jgi:hypothetical protein